MTSTNLSTLDPLALPRRDQEEVMDFAAAATAAARRIVSGKGNPAAERSLMMLDMAAPNRAELKRCVEEIGGDVTTRVTEARTADCASHSSVTKRD